MSELNTLPQPATHQPQDLVLDAKASQAPGRLSVKIIGTLQITRGGVTLDARHLGGPKPRQIIEILLLKLGTPVSKGRLIELLWDGQPPVEALPTLESYVSVLRRHIQPGSGKAGPLKTVTGGYMMDKSLVDLDLDRFETAARMAAQAAPEDAYPLLLDALRLATAPLLGDELVPAWAEDERALHASRVSATKVLAAETALKVGKASQAVEWAGEVVNGDPLCERAWTALILGLEQTGQHTEALRLYERCRRVMDEEMGCAPGNALRAAYARLLQATAENVVDLPERVSAPEKRTAAVAPSAPAAARERTGTDQIRILTIDDHVTFSELLNASLGSEPDMCSVGSATTVAAGIQKFLELRPDVIIMDYHLPDGTGLSAAEQILQHDPLTRIVMLTGDPSPDLLGKAATLGICAFLPKDCSLATVLDTLRHARTGNMVVHPSLVAQLGAREPAETQLTQDEFEVLRLMAAGPEIQSVADTLDIPLSSCRSYVKAIFSKLGTHTQLEAVIEASRRGMLDATFRA
jgi:SARP family transcriptional regulator, regulator of embCAB operon